MDRRQRPKTLGEANLIVFGQFLVAQQNDQVLVPDVLDLPKRRIAQGPA
jgi:hypothetical protein